MKFSLSNLFHAIEQKEVNNQLIGQTDSCNGKIILKTERLIFQTESFDVKQLICQTDSCVVKKLISQTDSFGVIILFS